MYYLVYTQLIFYKSTLCTLPWKKKCAHSKQRKCLWTGLSGHWNGFEQAYLIKGNYKHTDNTTEEEATTMLTTRCVRSKKGYLDMSPLASLSDNKGNICLITSLPQHNND